MFSLYHNKDKCELRIEPIGSLDINKSYNYDYVICYNDCYFICNSRDKLKEMAKVLLKEWQEETKDRFDKLMSTEIKNKYK